MMAPRFSVIVPTYNRCVSLKRTLESLFALEYADWELIVVNDGSIDETDSFLTEIIKKRSFIYIKQANRGPASARNAGIAQARGMYLAFTDDDCTVPPNWLRSFDEAFQHTNADIIGGLAKNRIDSNTYSEFSQKMTNYFVTTLSQQSKHNAFLSSNNIAYKKESVNSACGFDERFRFAGGEERTLHWNIISRGGKSILLDSNTIDHFHTLTRSSFARQQQNYGRGAYILYSIIGASASIPFFVYSGFLKNIFAHSFRQGMTYSILFFYAQFMVTIGYIKESLTYRHTATDNE